MEQQNKESNDEINLYDYWKVIAKRKILIIGLFIVIVGSTAIGSFLMPDIYRGEAVLLVLIKSELITAKEITDLIGNVDGEKRLSIVPKSYPNIKEIKFKASKDSKDKIVVMIDVKKVDDIPMALSEVINYLNNIDIIKSTVSQEKDMLLQKSAQLSDLLKSTPELSVMYNKLFKAGKLSTIGFNPIDFSKKIVETKIELLATEQQLSRLNNGGIEIAAQPYISNKPISPKILLNVVVAGILSLLLGIFLAAFIEFIGNIKNEKSKQVDKSLAD
jgi:capsular polysaccharide biosynthesis protein